MVNTVARSRCDLPWTGAPCSTRPLLYRVYGSSGLLLLWLKYTLHYTIQKGLHAWCSITIVTINDEDKKLDCTIQYVHFAALSEFLPPHFVQVKSTKSRCLAASCNIQNLPSSQNWHNICGNECECGQEWGNKILCAADQTDGSE